MGIESLKVINKMQRTEKKKDIYQCPKCWTTMEENDVRCSKCGGEEKVKIKDPSSKEDLKGFFS